jgi:hypothetical protein
MPADRPSQATDQSLLLRPTDAQISEASSAIWTDAQRNLGVDRSQVTIDNATWRFGDEREQYALVDATLNEVRVLASVPRSRFVADATRASNGRGAHVMFYPVSPDGSTSAWRHIDSSGSMDWYREARDLARAARAERQAAAKDLGRTTATTALLETQDTPDQSNDKA